MPRPRLVAAALALVVGCGGRAPATRDGGVDAPAATGLLAFDVTAILTPAKDAGFSELPPSGTFTLVLDVEARRVIVGGAGRGAVVPVATKDGRTFRAAAFSVSGAPGTACASGPLLDFASFEITVTGKELQGKATGSAQIFCGDCVFSEAFTATLAGVPDTTAPFLRPLGSPSLTPFDGLSVSVSEPLPATSTARLVASDGSVIALAPLLVEGTPPLIAGFFAPQIVLNPGQGYTVAADGLVDFAENRGAADPPLRLASFKPATLIPEDGFESATGATVGGANLVRGGVLSPIAGTASAYVGRAGSPAAPGVQPSAALDVRLPLQPGDKKLRFSYRVVSFNDGLPFGGVVSFGSVGHKPVPHNQLPAVPVGTPESWPGATRAVFVSPVQTAELDLPDDAQDELVVSITSFDASCGGLLPPPAAVLVDDLRVE